MAHDLLLGSSNRDWSRDVSGAEPAPLNLTDAEKDRIEKLAKLQMLAVRGDVEALKKVAQVNAALTALQYKAQRGDAQAKRVIETLIPTGLVQKFAASTKKGRGTLELAGDYDPTATTGPQAVLFPLLGAAAFAVVVEPGGNLTGQVRRSFNALLTSYKESDKVADKVTFSATLLVTDAITAIII